ncbi:MAG: hypothetical protein ACOYVF_08320, partial [Candidatus Zixiibacteriota bacterium]
MLRKSLLFLTIFLILAVFSVVSAIDNAELPQAPDRTASFVYQVQETLEHLSLHIDLWHDANLKNDKEKVEIFASVIDDIINEDIADSKMAIRNFAQRAVLENTDPGDGEKNPSVDFDRVKSSELFKKIVESMSVKKKLADALNRTEAFSNKYRLLNDYLYVLREEIRFTRVEVAEQETDG